MSELIPGVPGIHFVRAYVLARGQVANDAAPNWRKYSITTTAEKQCRRCKAVTILPGKRGWWWRYSAPKDSGRLIGRTTESLCAACFAQLVP
jgi:hypothetical protein